jgi:hypothetical protein
MFQILGELNGRGVAGGLSHLEVPVELLKVDFWGTDCKEKWKFLTSNVIVGNKF